LTKKGTSSTTGGQQITTKDVDQIFDFMAKLYLDAWTSKFSYSEIFENAQKKMWLSVMQTMDRSDIGKVLNYLMKYTDHDYIKFPPKPIEFKALIKKAKTKNIPSVEKLYEAAIKSDWSFHPLVFHCAKRCDLFYLKRAAANEGFKIFKRHYDSELDHYINGAILDAPHASIGRQKKNSEGPLEKILAERAKEIKGKLGESATAENYLDYIKQKIG